MPRTALTINTHRRRRPQCPEYGEVTNRSRSKVPLPPNPPPGSRGYLARCKAAPYTWTPEDEAIQAGLVGSWSAVTLGLFVLDALDRGTPNEEAIDDGE